MIFFLFICDIFLSFLSISAFVRVDCIEYKARNNNAKFAEWRQEGGGEAEQSAVCSSDGRYQKIPPQLSNAKKYRGTE